MREWMPAACQTTDCFTTWPAGPRASPSYGPTLHPDA